MFLYKPWRPKGFQISKHHTFLMVALSASFAYLFYWSTAIRNMFTLTQRGDRLKSLESDVYRRQILTTEVDSPLVGTKRWHIITRRWRRQINVEFAWECIWLVITGGVCFRKFNIRPGPRASDRWVRRLRGKHETFAQCCLNAGPAS